MIVRLALRVWPLSAAAYLAAMATVGLPMPTVFLDAVVRAIAAVGVLAGVAATVRPHRELAALCAAITGVVTLLRSIFWLTYPTDRAMSWPFAAALGCLAVCSVIVAANEIQDGQ